MSVDASSKHSNPPILLSKKSSSYFINNLIIQNLDYARNKYKKAAFWAFISKPEFAEYVANIDFQAIHLSIFRIKN